MSARDTDDAPIGKFLLRLLEERNVLLVRPHRRHLAAAVGTVLAATVGVGLPTLPAHASSASAT
ncbi:hypothetical protein HHL19_10875 [Streptomyces sp. R302]|uniref:hypothetical protein n=1 Tax=unclassified Streptomyces TaxID=2593676 RepID=UPI00145E12D0|nr:MULTISPECIES: hypothetical protein [unclassified Streptomyces]NML50166.1 hypothetical protein [Streptomyces sp. R301]NML79157.1 hypothetical protein [Streptomyces sp. R302]